MPFDGLSVFTIVRAPLLKFLRFHVNLPEFRGLIVEVSVIGRDPRRFFLIDFNLSFFLVDSRIKISNFLVQLVQVSVIEKGLGRAHHPHVQRVFVQKTDYPTRLG